MLNPQLRKLSFLALLLPLSCTNIADGDVNSRQAVESESATETRPGNYQKVTEVEGITEYRLDNGLQVLLFPDQTKETVTVNVTYLVGSKHENYGETGMAHLLEHLVFKGTPKHPDIPSELSAAGARPNGTTWTDRTNYFETFAATEENIEWALSMESSRMVDSFIAQEDLDSEMTVVRNEFERGENSPIRITLQRLASAAYDWHNYGKSTIGARSDLENVPIDRLKAFYKKYYQPDNAIVIVAGKFENEDMIERVNKYFGVIPKPARELPALYTSDPAKDGERSAIIRRVGDIQLAGLAYHIPAGSHPDFAAIQVLSSVLGDTPSGRLHKALVEEKLASRVFGFNFQWQEPGLAMYFAEVAKDGDLEKTTEQLVSIVESLKENPVTEDEVERIKRNALKNIELSFNNSEGIALQLSEWLGMGDWRLFFLNRDRIEAVTVEDVQRVAEKYLLRNNRTLAQFIPTEEAQRVDIPQVASVDEMVAGYTGREAIAQGELFEPTFDNIDNRTALTSLSADQRMTLLEKRTRGESVNLVMQLNFGDLESLTGKRLIGSMTASMLMRGAGDLSRQDIQDELDKLKATMQVGGGAESVTVRISTVKETLPQVLQLVDTILKSPSFDEDEFEQYRKTFKVDIERNLQDPQSLAFNAYNRLLSPYPTDHPSYAPTFAELVAEIEAVELDDLKAFHAKFYGANKMNLAVVGDFSSAEVESTITDMLNDWNSDVKFERIVNPYQEIEVQRIVFDTPDKENATFIAGTSLPVGRNHPDAPALELGNYIFGGGFLNSRLATRLRQQDGLSYGTQSFMQSGNYSDITAFGAFAISAPQNLDRVEQGFKEEFERMLRDGFTDEEIESAKSGLLQSRQVSRAQDNELAGLLLSNTDLERDMQWHKNYEENLMKLTADDVLEVMNKYLDMSKISIISAGDMSKAKAAE